MERKLSEYEKLREKNIADNKRVLAELGLLNPYKQIAPVLNKGIKRKRDSPVSKAQVPRKVKVVEDADPESSGSVYDQGTTLRRKSARLRGIKDAADMSLVEEEQDDDEEEDERRKSRVPAKRPNFYGSIPGVEVGTVWETRMQCCADGVQRPTVAGIHAGQEGAYSIALSGGYEDDIDLGTCFTYTGEGGRDLKGTASNPKNLRTAPQTKDQLLSRGNAALVKSVETGNPVRVIRGYKLKSPFAPEEGYRYDGLYKVEKYWYTIGMAGYHVFKFALKRLEDQSPPPWTMSEDSKDADNGEEITESAKADEASTFSTEDSEVACETKPEIKNAEKTKPEVTNEEDSVVTSSGIKTESDKESANNKSESDAKSAKKKSARGKPEKRAASVQSSPKTKTDSPKLGPEQEPKSKNTGVLEDIQENTISSTIEAKDDGNESTEEQQNHKETETNNNIVDRMEAVNNKENTVES